MSTGAFGYVNLLKSAADASWTREEVLTNNIANVDLSTENVELASEQINYNALIDSMNNEFSRFKSVLK